MRPQGGVGCVHIGQVILENASSKVCPWLMSMVHVHITSYCIDSGRGTATWGGGDWRQKGGALGINSRVKLSCAFLSPLCLTPAHIAASELTVAQTVPQRHTNNHASCKYANNLQGHSPERAHTLLQKSPFRDQE